MKVTTVFLGLAMGSGLAIGSSLVSATAARAQASEPCIGQLMLFGGTFCPRNWVEANGSTLDIGSNQALFSIYGTTYGGNGSQNFGLPDLRGRAPVGQGQGPNLPNYTQGAKIGAPTVTMTEQQLPTHSHSLNASQGQADNPDPAGGTLASSQIYNGRAPGVSLAPSAIGKTGQGAPIPIQSPAQVIRWCVATQGTYCSRN